MGPPTDPPTLRILAINDVYELAAFPHLATFVRAEKARAGTPGGPDAVICTVAGDFLSPSQLSSLDFGQGMVRVLNACGVDYACLGNHESDVPHAGIVKRIDESEFVWINTNLPNFLDEDADPAVKAKMTDLAVVQVGDRRVGLIGLCGMTSAMLTNPGFRHECVKAYRRPIEVLRELHARHVATGELALLVPITHQPLPEDRALLQSGLAPLILAGHEHEVIIEQVPAEGLGTADVSFVVGETSVAAQAKRSERLMVKGGMDANNIVVVDVTWDSSGKPTVTHSLLTTTAFPADPAVTSLAADLNLRTAALAHIPLTLFVPPPYLPLSSKGSRVGPTTVARMLCSIGRDGSAADLCMINGAAIRIERDFDARPPPGWGDDELGRCCIPFTYSDLLALLPFAMLLVTVPLPGNVVLDAIRYSRKSILTKGYSNGYLHTDDGVVFRSREATPEAEIESIAGSPFDPNKVYRTAVLDVLMDGLAHIEPLTDWVAADPAHAAALDAVRDDGRRVKLTCVGFFATLWWRLLPDFESLDADRDGFVTMEELRSALESVIEGVQSSDGKMDDEERIALDKVVQALLGRVDANKDGLVDKEEYLEVTRQESGGTMKLFEGVGKKAIARGLEVAHVPAKAQSR
ncbi:Metallo-dependent phosphatase-like protein [Hyaloraphidium curvatum]|nr:Metallo-dependent phosphatase-like protein [Hyaloraphidium curvatum]